MPAEQHVVNVVDRLRSEPKQLESFEHGTLSGAVVADEDRQSFEVERDALDCSKAGYPNLRDAVARHELTP